MILTPQLIQLPNIRINYIKIGDAAQAVLLLHGYPQNHRMWEPIIPYLAKDFTVVASDLRGYGDSDKPTGDREHANYCKRVMAEDQVALMSRLGYEQFYLVGHDRGARVAHRLALDHPGRVQKLALLDILPTYDLYQTTDQEFATSYYHWFFLIQPYPFPENLISNNPDYFLDYCLQSWSSQPSSFTPEALADYRRCFGLWETIHGTCEDYRAAATIDLTHDRADRHLRITCPLLVLWGSRGVMGKKYDLGTIWRQRAINYQGFALDCGHFLPEEAPEATYSALAEFLLGS